ncbi:MAG TPA: hypothetical protein VNW52_05440, partial [Burkholderiaceae bacterium]|nr:hypothetical protein [Burkholderiaceae bacterium]
MKLHRSALFALFLFPVSLLMAGHAHAEDNFVYGALELGDSIGYGRVINDSFSVRADIGHKSSSMRQSNLGENGFNVNPASGTTFHALADWFPFSGSGFRVSGGLSYNSNRTIDSVATPDGLGNYHLNGVTYAANEVGQLRAETNYRKLAPEIGIGWESAPASKAGWRFISGLNLRLLSSGNTTLTATNPAGNSTLQQNVVAEQARVNSDVGNRF